MPIFKYSGVNKSGRRVKGYIENVSEAVAQKELFNQGIFADKIKGGTTSKKSFFEGFQSSGKKQISEVYFQLSILLRSEVPLLTALNVVRENIKSKKIQIILGDIASKVAEGVRLSAAMGPYESLFGEVYINLIKTSENVGSLPQVLHDIAEYEESRRAHASNLASALSYPLIVLFLGVVMIIFMFAKVVPNMKAIFSSYEGTLPIYTRILFGISNLVTGYGTFVALSFILIIYLVTKIYRNKEGKFRFNIDRRLYNSKHLQVVYLSRLTYVLSFQLKEGLPLVEALKNAYSSTTNVYFKSIMKKILEQVKSGVKFSKAMSNTEAMPKILIASIATGERTGSLAPLLGRVSEYYSKSVNKTITLVVTLTEPLLLVFIGGLVGFIVIALIVPMLNLSSSI